MSYYRSKIGALYGAFNSALRGAGLPRHVASFRWDDVGREVIWSVRESISSPLLGGGICPYDAVLAEAWKVVSSEWLKRQSRDVPVNF